MAVNRGILYEIATGGVLYDVATGRVLFDNSGRYEVTKDQYFTRNQPAKSEELKNRVTVKYSPLIEHEDGDQEIYRSPEPISLAAGAEIIIDAEYDVSIDVTGDHENDTGSTFSLTVENYYGTGALVTVKNTGANPGTTELVISGTPLVVDETAAAFEPAEDSASIAENGVLEYKFPENHLIQTAEQAAAIAAALITSYATPRKDVSLNWRGDMALELGDEITVPVYQRGTTTVNDDFYVFKTKLDYDGTLKAATEGRKI